MISGIVNARRVAQRIETSDFSKYSVKCVTGGQAAGAFLTITKTLDHYNLLSRTKQELVDEKNKLTKLIAGQGGRKRVQEENNTVGVGQESNKKMRKETPTNNNNNNNNNTRGSSTFLDLTEDDM